MTDLERRVDSHDQRNGCLGNARMANNDTDIEYDSIRENGEVDIHQLLIHIDEEMGSDDLDALKFLCRDEISVAKLEAAKSALDVFESMKKKVLIDVNNYNFLLECLGRIHRFDLVKKLGYEPAAVKAILPTIKKINLFRTMLMDIADDLEEKEFDKIKFLLSGKIKKKKMKDQSTLLDMFIFMEQEGLLAPNRTQELRDMLHAINRVDLARLVEEFAGLPSRRPEPVLTPSNNASRQQNGIQGNPLHSLHIGSAGGADRISERNVLHVNPQRQNALPVRNGTNNGLAARTSVPANDRPPLARAPPIDRSPSAGTISVPSEGSFDAENAEIAEIPQGLFLQIANDLKHQFIDVGIELGFSNDDLDTFTHRFPDPSERTRELLNTWRNAKLDKGQIVPGLRFVLTRLGCKTAADALNHWIEELSDTTGQRSQVQGQRSQIDIAVTRPGLDHEINFTSSRDEARPPMDDFQPQGPPGDNNYTSLRPAQPPSPSIQGEIIMPAATVNALQHQFQRILQTSSQNSTPDQISNELIRLTQMYQTQVPAGNQVPLSQHLQTATGQGQLLANGNLPQGQGQAVPAPSVDALSFEFPEYKMNNKPRGWCVIINNRDFYVQNGDSDSKEMPGRAGTDKDAESLQFVFEKLGFIVLRRDNLTDTEMMQFLVDTAHNVNHTLFDCFICCILTHGVLSHLYGSNGRLISIKDITSTFQANRCPTLAGKPKLFFLQACQGRDKMAGGEIERDMANVVPVDETETDTNDKELIPNEADFLLGYATVPGYVSFRSRNHGSWYIRKLCEILEKHSERHDLMSILVEVNREVSHANAHVDGGIFKQTPAPLVTLRKKVFFR